MNIVRRSLVLIGLSALSANLFAFSSAPGAVQNLQVLPIYNHSVEVRWDAPVNAGEIKAYYVSWIATDGTGAGNKLVPPDTPNMAQIQALDPTKVYAINIYPVDTDGTLASPVTLTDIRAQGTFELEMKNATQNGQTGFLFLPQNGLPNQRTDITKLSNDVEPTVQFGGDPNATAFDFAAIANNGQDHWHWAGVRVGQGSFTTRVKGSVYIGDGGTRSLQFDNDTGPFGARAWYVVLSPTKMDRFNLIPNGRDDDSPVSYPSEQVRIKVVHENATVSRYHQNAKVSEVPFNWRKKVYINARQRLRLDINQSGVTFLADTDYTGTPQIIGTFGTDLSSWTYCYVYFVMGMYTPNENSRAGTNYVGTRTQQDALALFHWGNVSVTAAAGYAPPTELSYFKDPEIGVRSQTRLDPNTQFTINIDALTSDVVSREFIFTDATTWPGCDIPGAAEQQALSNPSTQVLINGTAIPNPTPAQVQYDAPGHRYFIPAGVLHAGANTVRIVQNQNPVSISIFNPHIDIMVPAGSAMISAYTPPPLAPDSSDTLDTMPMNAQLEGWALPTVNFNPPHQASGTLTLSYEADAAHTLITSGLDVAMDSFTVTLGTQTVWIKTVTISTGAATGAVGPGDNVGVPYSSGTLSLYTTDYADGYYPLSFNAHTIAGAIGSDNGSDPNQSEAGYDWNRSMLVYNGAAVTDPPTIQNLTFYDLSNGTTVQTQVLASGDTEYITHLDQFHLQLTAQTSGFFQDIALQYQDEDGSWNDVEQFKAGSLADQEGHFDLSVGTLTIVSAGAPPVTRMMLDWYFTVAAAHEKPFVFVDPDGPGTHYRLVATNVGNLQAIFPFTYKLHDPDMAYFEQVHLPAQISIDGSTSASFTIKNIGTTAWTNDGNHVLTQFMEDMAQLFGPNGVPVQSSVAPGQDVTLQMTTPPLAPAPMQMVNLEMATLDPAFELFASSAVTTSIVTGNNATCANVSVPTVMDANEPYSVTVACTNTGVTTWTSAGGYSLIAANPVHNVLWSVVQVPLISTETVAPGATKTFVFNVYSPGFPNYYIFSWQMNQNARNYGEVFGTPSPALSIAVGNPQPRLPFFLDQPLDQFILPGQSATLWATVIATPTATLQWQEQAPADSSMSVIPSATGSSFTTGTLGLSDDGSKFTLVATNVAGVVTSRVATVHVSTTPWVPPGAFASYNAAIVNAVAGNGTRFVPKVLKVNVTVSTTGVDADTLQLLIGKGNNPGGPTQTVNLDPTQSAVASIDLSMLSNIQHGDQLNFSLYVEYPDGTTTLTPLDGVYTVLLIPPPAPTLGFLPQEAAANAKISAAPDFVNRIVQKVNFSFARTSASSTASVGQNAVFGSLGAATASASLSPAASQLDFQAMGLTPGVWQIQAVASDWVGNQSAPSQATIYIVGDNLSNVLVYPSPWDTRKDTGFPITFTGMTDPATVKLFTLSGFWIRTLHASKGTATWDLKNDSGQNVASGLYLYLITDPAGDKATGKFGVIR